MPKSRWRGGKCREREREEKQKRAPAAAKFKARRGAARRIASRFYEWTFLAYVTFKEIKPPPENWFQIWHIQKINCCLPFCFLFLSFDFFWVFLWIISIIGSGVTHNWRCVTAVALETRFLSLSLPFCCVCMRAGWAVAACLLCARTLLVLLYSVFNCFLSHFVIFHTVLCF